MFAILSFWPLFITREITIERRIPASKAAVLRLMQDPDQMLQLNPLINSIVQDTPDETQAAPDMSWYTIQESVPLGSGRSALITIRELWGKVPDGTDARVFASAGTRLTNEVRVRELKGERLGNGEEVVLVSEKVVVRALFFLMPYIASTARNTQIAIFDAVAERLLEKEDSD